MHSGSYSQDKGTSHQFNPKSGMKPLKNIKDKYVAATDEVDKYNRGEHRYTKGKGWR